jgi:molecular chaperone GrpE (heat shock protein)
LAVNFGSEQPLAMKFVVLFALSLCLQGFVATSEKQHSVAAVQKVIQMLSDMAAKAKQEKNDEEVAFAEFSTWCTGEKANLKTSIQKATESTELYSAEIEKLTAETAALSDAIAKLSSDVSDFEADIKSSTAQRSKDSSDYLAESKDYSESLDALDRAILVMQKQDYDRTGSKAALLQLSESNQLPAKAQAMVTAFMGMMQDDEPSEYSAPEANAYEFQSGGIVALLKKLKDEFRETCRLFKRRNELKTRL